MVQSVHTAPRRKRWKIYSVAGTAIAIIGLMIALLGGFGPFCLRARHFEELQIGMTRAEVYKTIELRTIDHCFYTGDGPSREDWLVSYWETRSLPPFGATLEFVDDRLATKE